jgi:hypothetical protein
VSQTSFARGESWSKGKGKMIIENISISKWQTLYRARM